MFEKLFSPIKIKDMELKNRIILPAMGTKFSGDGSEVTDKLIDYHVARVKGGSGLNQEAVFQELFLLKSVAANRKLFRR